MTGTVSILARAILLVGGAAFLWFMGSPDGHAAMATGSPGLHVLTVGLAGNLLFTAFPFRRRNDLGAGLALAMAGTDLLAHVPLTVALCDMAGVLLVMLPVWVERMRARTHRERRQRKAWRNMPFATRPGTIIDVVELPSN